MAFPIILVKKKLTRYYHKKFKEFHGKCFIFDSEQTAGSQKKVLCIMSLTHFRLIFHFYTPWNDKNEGRCLQGVQKSDIIPEANIIGRKPNIASANRARATENGLTLPKRQSQGAEPLPQKKMLRLQRGSRLIQNI